MDLTVPITGGTVMTPITVMVWWYIKERIKESRDRRMATELTLKTHIDTCTDKNLSHARLEEKVSAISASIDELKTAATNRDTKIDNLGIKLDNLANVLVAKRTI